MKPKHIFWGLLLVTTGILILLYNFGSLYINLDDYWKFWPLVLVLFGFSFVIRSNWLKSFLAGASGIVLAFALFSLFSFIFGFINNEVVINNNGVHFNFDDDNYGSETSYYSEVFKPGTNYAKLVFNGGAGTFGIKDTTDKLFEAITYGRKNNYNFSSSDEDGSAYLKMKMKDQNFTFGFNKKKNKADIKLNTKPVWDLDFKVGAASVDFDLTPFITRNIEIESGAASVVVKLGNKSDITNLDFDAGASSCTIYVPESAGCEINAEASLSSKHFNDFNKIDNHLYKTDNYDSAKKKIFLRIKTGVSSITVRRYTDNSSW